MRLPASLKIQGRSFFSNDWTLLVLSGLIFILVIATTVLTLLSFLKNFRILFSEGSASTAPEGFNLEAARRLETNFPEFFK